MSVSTASTPAASWQNARALYPLYGSLAREFVIEIQPCPELEEALDSPPAESVIEAEKWLQTMDQRIQVHQLRQFLQTSPEITEDILRELLVHYLSKGQRTDHDRDKVDFLLVQLFSQQATFDISDSDLTLTAVAKALEPALGTFEVTEPEWLSQLNDLLSKAESATDLNALFTSRIIEQGREIKVSRGDRFFEPVAMAAFARFGFLIRRMFFRLMHQDLNVILVGLRELDARGVTALDCRKAQFAADEPVARLRMICQSWKVMFHAEYSAGQPLCILVDLRKAVELALANSAESASTQIKTNATAAGAEAVTPLAEAATENNVAQEFEVSSSPDWDPDAATNLDPDTQS
jgi:hypothetical protein